MLAKIGPNNVPSHRYYKARPTAPSINPPTAHYEGSPAATPTKRRTTTFISQKRQDDYSGGGSFGRDWLGESPGQTWTARERIKSTSCVSLSADGRWLAVGESGYNPRVLLYSTVEDVAGELPTSIVTDHTYGVRCIAFSGDMRYLATLGNLNDGFLFVWSLNSKTGQLSLHSVNKCTTNICDMTWCGKSLVTVGTRHVKVWQVKDPMKQSPTRKSRYRPSEIYPPSPGPIPLQGRNCLLGSMVDSTFTCITSIDERRLVLGTETGHLCSVDTSLAALELQVLKKTDFSITSIAFLAVAKQILLGTSHGLYTEDIESLPKQESVPFDADVRRKPSRSSSIRRSLGLVPPRGRSVMAIGVLEKHTITLDNDGSLQIQRRDVDDKDEDRPTFAAHNSILHGVQALPATSDLGSFFTWSKNGEVKFWNADGGLLRQRHLDLDELDADGENYQNELCRLRYWPVRGYFIAGDRLGLLKLIKDQDWRVTHTIRAHSSEITSIAISDEDRLIATCSRDRMVQLFRASGDNLELLQTMDDHVGSVNQLLFAHSGERLLSCSADRSLIVRERVLREQDGIQAIAYLATKVLTLKSAPLSMTISGPNVLAAATVDRRITKIDLLTGTVMESFRIGDSESDDTVALNSVIYAPPDDATETMQGLLIGYCSMDKSIRVYNERNLSLLGRESGHTEGVSDVALLEQSDSPILGRQPTIVSTGLDGTIMIWRILKTASLLPHLNASPNRPQGSEPLKDEMEETNAKPSPASLPPLRKVLTKVDIADLNRGSTASPTTPRSLSPVRLKRKTSRLALSTTMEDVEETPTKCADASTAVDSLALHEKENARCSASPVPPSVSQPKKQRSRTELRSDVEQRGTRGRTGSPSPPPLPMSMPTTPKQRQKSNNSRLRRPPSVPTDLRSQGSVSGRRQSLSHPSDFGSLGMATEQVGRMLRMYRKKLVHSRETVDLDDLEDEVSGLLKTIQERKNRTQAILLPTSKHERQGVQEPNRRGNAKAATESEVDQLATLLGKSNMADSPAPVHGLRNSTSEA